jgi:hypothetical protein
MLAGALPTLAAATTQAQAPTASGVAAGQVGKTRVHGVITDPDGALIPGASVTLTPGSGAAVVVKSGSDGTYSAVVAPGTYTVRVTMPGFATYMAPNITISAAAGTTLNAKMQIGVQSEEVTVEANSMQLSVSPDSNQSAMVITGKDLEALSDDPDELSDELTALAGPSAGPNGGQIYVDGFTGGQLPPKSSIREIRINQNPFSAEYDQLGYGRIEVFTKPGTDQLHGNLQINGDPSQLNTGDPLATGYQPPYHVLFVFGNLTGPLSKSASYNLGGTYRQIQQDEETDAIILATAANPTTVCIPPNVTGCVYTPYQVSTYYPQIRADINPRLDLSLGARNVLTTRYQYVNNTSTNAGLGNLTLPSAAYNTNSLSNILQMSDTETFNPNLISETRFEYEREHVATTALSNLPTLQVGGFFTGGGYTGQNLTDHQDHFEGQSYNSLQLKKNFIRFGGRLRATREAQDTGNNTNGSFVYSALTTPTTCTVTPCVDHSYQSGTPSQFTFTTVNNHKIGDTYLDFETYAESDWKARQNLTISYGLRYEIQSHLSDHHDFAPRLAFSYGLFSGKGAPKTVLRGGFGIFYTRFQQSDILTLEQENGVNETVYTVSNPSASCSPGATNLIVACGAAATAQTVYTAASNLRASYITEFAGGVDQQIGRSGTISVNYVHSQGVHQLATQNIGYNFTTPSLSTAEYQFFGEGVFNQNQLVVHAHVQTSKAISLFGYYSLNSANGDTSGTGGDISTPGNISADYGRTSFDVKNRLFMAGSISLPKFFQVSPFMIAQSGNPYNVTTGNDNYNDSFFNVRPYKVDASVANASNADYVKTIPGCGTFAQPGYESPGASIAPINDCTGPVLFTFNFRLTKTFGFGARTSGGGGNGGADGGHGDHGGGHGGGHGGFGPASTGRRYNLSFGLQVQNLFNNEDLATPQGNLSSAYFGQSTQLAGGPYTTQSALRRITLQTSFYF